MASPRDSRGRFVKTAASIATGVDAAVSTPSPPAPPPSYESIVMEQQQLMEKLMAQHEAAVKQSDERMKAAVDRYEQMIQSAQSSLENLLVSQSVQSPSSPIEPPPTPAPPTPAPPAPTASTPTPAAVWIKAPDGENFLLVNQAGAVMFLAIFERMGVVFEELKKLAPKRPGR